MRCTGSIRVATLLYRTQDEEKQKQPAVLYYKLVRSSVQEKEGRKRRAQHRSIGFVLWLCLSTRLLILYFYHDILNTNVCLMCGMSQMLIVVCVYAYIYIRVVVNVCHE